MSLNSFIGVNIKIGDKLYRYKQVQDDSGLDCGVCLPKSEFSVGPLVRSASQMVHQLVGGYPKETECTVAVCEVEVQSPSMKVFTIVLGLDKKVPLLGRFMLHDVTARAYAGRLAEPIDVCAYMIQYGL